MKLLILGVVVVAATFGALTWLSRARWTGSGSRRPRFADSGTLRPTAGVDSKPRQDSAPSSDGGRRTEREVDDAHAFYFRGPHQELNVPARSIEALFEIAERLDDDVWRYHLVRGDYARWFRDVMCDECRATRAEALATRACSPRESRALLRAD